MSAVLNSRDLTGHPPNFAQHQVLRHFEVLAAMPDGVTRLRNFILKLAFQGKLVTQASTTSSLDDPVLSVRLKDAGKTAAGTRRNSSNEALYALPPHWQWVRIGDIADLQNGDRSRNYPSRDKFVTSGVAFINAGHLENERIDYSRMNYISRETFDLLRSGKVRRNDIVYCLRGSLGKFGLVEDESPGAIASSLVIVRLLDDRLIPFVLRYLGSPSAVDQIRRFDNGTAQPNLAAGDLRKFLLPLPPVEEQLRIVSSVDELMRLCDALESSGRLEADQHARLLSTLLGTLTDSRSPEELAANWQRLAAQFDLLLNRREAVDAFERTVVELAVRGSLVPQDAAETRPTAGVAVHDQAPYELPINWRWLKVSELRPEYQNGASSRGDAGGRLVTVLRLADIKDRRVSLADTRQVRINDRDVEKYRLHAGDILITRVNGSADIVGRFNLVEGETDAIYCDHFIRLRVRRDWLDPKYLALFGACELVRSRIGSLFITTAGQKTVNQGHVGSLPVAVPPLAEQSRILARVDQLRRLCAELREKLAAAQALQTRLGDALVQEAVEPAA